MKFFGIWTVLVALIISTVAAYYSIVGLVAIFAAAVTPIVIMGAALEVGKLTTAVWLHTYWNDARFAMKAYLTFALVMLMFITSMGIFGFLSKAHIEQTSQASEGTAQLERIENEIARIDEIIARAEQKIVKLDNTAEDADAGIQEKINQEQKRIDTAYERIQPAIDEQKQILEDNLELYNAELQRVDTKINTLAELSNVDTSNRDAVKRLQALVGARPDGAYGSGTARKVDEYRSNLNQERANIVSKIQQLRQANTAELARIRGLAEKEIADSNKLVSRLREQLGTTVSADVTDEIQVQQEKIKQAEIEIEALIQEKFAIESENRKLEAEVGPVKYIAELVYGSDANKDTLEEAVRWVIIILVLVFDPLAVVLVIAGITLLERSREQQRAINEKKTEAELEELKVELETAKTKQTEALDELDRLSEEKGLNDLTADTNDNPLIKEHNEPIEPSVDEIIEEQIKNLELDEILHEDENGQFYVHRAGERRYVVNKEQLELNRKARVQKVQEEKRKIERVVERMKEEGMWPNSPVESPTERDAIREILDADKSGELEELLEKADEHTLKEVYEEIIKDLKSK